MARTGNLAARRRAPRPEKVTTGVHRRLRDTDLAPLVLLVDDSEDVREMYSEFFVHSGLRVVSAVDGDHALWKVVLLKPDIVVMDLAMPFVDGRAATEQIKQHPKTKHIPVVVLTGHVTDESLRQAKAAGADEILTKPCAPADLLAVLRKLLART
jgi:two-component system, cell cycle response regulator DivK